jgi:hypothetical protein
MIKTTSFSWKLVHSQDNGPKDNQPMREKVIVLLSSINKIPPPSLEIIMMQNETLA